MQFCLQTAEIKNWWKCWLWGVQETKCQEIYTTGHGKASPFQPWWSVRGAVRHYFDINRCSLSRSMFYFCLLRLGLAVTGAPAENFGTRIHGVIGWHILLYRHLPLYYLIISVWLFCPLLLCLFVVICLFVCFVCMSCLCVHNKFSLCVLGFYYGPMAKIQ